MNSLLTVCVGNICRSPMAEGLFHSELPEFNVRSAGIGALIGSPPDQLAIDIMSDRNIDISSHLARPVTRSMCEQADVILVMDSSQKRFLEMKFPFVRGRVFRIGMNEGVDVPDPYRKGKEAFLQSFFLIDAGVSYWVSKFKKMNEIKWGF